ncbi:MAG: CRTAC1 family protein, partial [Acidobacteriota bacterium]
AEMMGPGGALIDFDGDGDLDVYLPQGLVLDRRATAADLVDGPPRHAPPFAHRAYRNDLVDGRPRFVDVTNEAGLAALPPVYGVAVAAGDVDHDGRIDLYVANFGGNRLLRNRPGPAGFRFVDATGDSPGLDDPRWSVGATFVDVDRDGWLDLYVVNYVDHSVDRHVLCPSPAGGREYCGPLAYRPIGDRLFRNRGGDDPARAGTFEDVSLAAGVAAVAPGTGLGVVAADLDQDGWLDLYVANDEMSNHFLRHRGKPAETPWLIDDAVFAGVAVSGEGARESSMGVAAADVDDDGDLDLFLTHLNGQTNTLYRNEGEGFFRDVSEPSGAGLPSWNQTGFGTGFFDLEHDGDLDLVAVNGAVRLFDTAAATDGDDRLAPGSVRALAQPDLLLRNEGGGRFAPLDDPASAAPVLAAPAVGRGLAFGDVDNDGDVDFLRVDCGAPARLVRNRAADGAPWLGVRLLEASGRDALGATVALVDPARPDALRSGVRRIATDGSYASASDPRAVLVPRAGGPQAVRIVWPDGAVEVRRGLAPGQYHTLRRADATPARGASPSAEPSGRP